MSDLATDRLTLTTSEDAYPFVAGGHVPSLFEYYSETVATFKLAEDKLLDAMSPAIKKLVIQDAGFRLASVLQSVQAQKYQKQVGIYKLRSCIEQLKETADGRANQRAQGWGSW